MSGLRLYLGQGASAHTAGLTLRPPACLVGSAPDCDMRIEGAPALALELHGSEKTGAAAWTLQTLTTCTWNGQPLKPRAAAVTLRHGDRIEVAGATLIFEEGETALADSSRQVSRNAPDQASDRADAFAGGGARSEAVLKAMHDFAREAASENDLQRVLEASLAAAKQALQANEAFVLLIASDGSLKTVAGLAEAKTSERFSDTVVQSVLREGRGIALADASNDARFGSARSIADLQLRSVICAPVLLGGKVTGCIYLGTRRLQVSYGPEDLGALAAFCQLIGLLVHNVEFIASQAASLRELASVDEAGLLAQSPAMLKVLREADAVAMGDIGVLIQGETGTGKEGLAERLHRKSARAKGPLVAINCSSLRGELLESELFGYKRGAFTGALQDRTGLFAAARGGTLFLDEIGEMDLGLQAKLLRAIETGKIRPVGATQEESVDVRIVCATHRDLKTLTAEKTFREDLYYRLAPVTLHLPPLRERGGDIALLAHAFLERFKARYPAKDVRGFHPQSLRAMVAYAWPGNIRELLNAVHKAVLLAATPLVEVDLGTGTGPQGEPEFLGFDAATAQFQKQYLQEALSLADGNREQAAKILKMSRSTFFRYLSQLGVD